MILVGLSVGLLFGALAERTAFSPYDAVREVVAGERRSSAAVVLVAMASAVAATQFLLVAGHFETTNASYLPARTSLFAVLVGGVLFGVGAVLARGCLTRCTVRAGTGDLLALVVILVAGLSAYMTTHGALSPPRALLHRVLAGDVASIDLPTRIADMTGIASATIRVAAIGVAAMAIGVVVLYSRFSREAMYAIGFGPIVAGAWYLTAEYFADPFEIARPNAVSIAGPLASAIHCIFDAMRVVPDYGTGLVAGVLGGAALSALRRGHFVFVAPVRSRPFAQAAFGGLLMGFGAVTSVGCTIGQGLSGLSLLSIMAPVALLGMLIGICGAFAWIGVRGGSALARA